ncbi:MAG: MoaD/ThiS family protein [Gemmatales bacterium]
MVTVYFFAGLREAAKKAAMEINWHPGLSAGLVRKTIALKMPEIDSLLKRSSMAVNDLIVSDEYLIPSGADISLLPPVSGG